LIALLVPARAPRQQRHELGPLREVSNLQPLPMTTRPQGPPPGHGRPAIFGRPAPLLPGLDGALRRARPLLPSPERAQASESDRPRASAYGSKRASKRVRIPMCYTMQTRAGPGRDGPDRTGGHAGDEGGRRVKRVERGGGFRMKGRRNGRPQLKMSWPRYGLACAADGLRVQREPCDGTRPQWRGRRSKEPRSVVGKRRDGAAGSTDRYGRRPDLDVGR
jgi:hypothetical protein